jgi:uncharacterized membrane protein YedE/YeeE
MSFSFVPSSLFTPLTGLAGGAMIGLAADVLLLFNGDIMGASGIVSSVLLRPLQSLRDPDKRWKLVFLSSFLLASASAPLSPPAADPSSSSPGRALSPLALSLAGFLVGLGTNLGNGCTSGHGICGMARFSKRSWAAVAAFMATGIATSSYIEASVLPGRGRLGEWAKLLFPKSSGGTGQEQDGNPSFGLALGIAAAAAAALAPLWFPRGKKGPNGEKQEAGAGPGDDHVLHKRKAVPAMVSGAAFAAGLRISQMVVQSKVLGFLNVTGLLGESSTAWDPTLVMVMAGGFLMSFLGYQWTDSAHRVLGLVPASLALKRPVCHRDYDYDDDDENGDGVPPCDPRTFDACLPDSRRRIDGELLLGAALFGVGWGLAGYCPGPALYWAGRGDAGLLRSWWPAFWAGSYSASRIKACRASRKQKLC